MVAFSSFVEDEGEHDEWRARRIRKYARRLKVAVAVQRRRVVAALAALESGQGPAGRKRRESPFCWEDHLARLTEAEFKARYRLDFDSFHELLRASD